MAPRAVAAIPAPTPSAAPAREGPRDQDGTRPDTPRMSSVRVTTQPLLAYLATRVVLVAAVLLGSRDQGSAVIRAMLESWDGQHYLAIAAHGYPAQVHLHSYSLLGFFPGLPLAIRGVHAVTGLGFLTAGVAVSLVGGAFLVAIASVIAADVWGEERGRRAGILLAVFPGSMLLGLPYAEAVALPLAAGCLWALRRDRWVTAGALAGLATLCSPVVLPLVGACAWAAYRSRRWRSLAAPLLAPAGFVAYLGYLWARTGSPWAWFRVQATGWGQAFSFLAAVHHLSDGPGLVGIEVTTLAFLAWATYAAVRARLPLPWAIYAAVRARLPLPWAIYAAGVVASTLFDPALWPSPRFTLDAFPLVLAVAAAARQRSFLLLVVVLAGLLPLTLLAYTTLGNVTAQP